MRLSIVAGILVPLSLAVTPPASAAVLLGGGPRATDCLVAVVAGGTAFPAGGARGVTCTDGDACDADGTRDGVCHIEAAVCLNVTAPGCQTGTVQKLNLNGRQKSVSGAAGEAFFGQVMALGTAASGLLPSAESPCTPVAPVPVYVHGPNGHGEFTRGAADLRVKARTSRGADRDVAQLVCLPAGGVTPTTTVTTSTATTTVESSTTTTVTTTTATTTTGGASTTTTTQPVPDPPGAGLQATITNATITPDRSVVVTFTLTDAAGLPVIPTGSATTDEKKARVRMTISRIDEDTETVESFSTAFTRYHCYITANQTSPITHQSSAQPTMDSGGTFATVDAVHGIYTYTLHTKLPADYPATLTHTVGAQIERTVGGLRSVANPIYDFVPAGGTVTTERQVVATTACNGCHDPLSAHGGGRREVRLCQLCHTDQAVDPDTGNSIDFKVMVHRIHRGKDLPSIAGGAIGDHYSIIGFGQSETTWSEKKAACVGGAKAGLACTGNGDCPSGTCTGTTVVGVGFPQDLRGCESCHTGAPQAANYREKPSAAACTSCHDDVNPSQVATAAGAPGANHVAEDQPEAFCRLCHTATADEDFDLSVPGAHVIPERAAILTGLQAEILSATGTASNPVTMTFRVRDSAGTALDVRSGFSRVAIAMSGPSTDFGGSSKLVITPTIVGSGSSGTLSAPDGNGIFTYTLSAGNALPADATGTWRVGLEVRRAVTVNGSSVNEAAPNPVFDFGVGGASVTPRRTVVATENCESCHDQFGKGFSIHGNLRNNVEYCVVCHNPNANDAARRIPVIATGADAATASIDFKHMIHKIHTGENLTQQPYIVYGFGSAANDFGEVLFPGNRADCATCHVNGSQLLPLDAGLLPTRVSAISSGVEVVSGSVPPITDACTSCHDDAAVMAHAQTNTTAGGAEACAVCHGEGSIAAVSEVHANR